MDRPLIVVVAVVATDGVTPPEAVAVKLISTGIFVSTAAVRNVAVIAVCVIVVAEKGICVFVAPPPVMATHGAKTSIDLCPSLETEYRYVPVAFFATSARADMWYWRIELDTAVPAAMVAEFKSAGEVAAIKVDPIRIDVV